MHQRVQGGRLAWPVVWLCAATLCATSAAAQSWKPEKNVEIIVPGGAGGGQDRTARIMQKIMQDGLVPTAVTVSNPPRGGNKVGYLYLYPFFGCDAHIP